MDIYPPSCGLSLCAGAGGLDLGLSLAEPGFETACWVEWEPEAQKEIIAAQRSGLFEPAPVWNDVFTFVGSHWRGHVDTVLAGYPCQPFSAAGRRKGARDQRHLWPDIARIIQEVRPRWVFLENVAGHLSLGLEAVLRDLRKMGFRCAAGAFSAAEAGGSHKRLRVFIVAHASDRQLSQPGRGPQGREGAGSAGQNRKMDDATSARRHDEGERTDAISESGQCVFGSGCAELVPDRQVGDASGAGLERREQPRAHGISVGAGAHGSTAQSGRALVPLAPPGPEWTDGWAAVLDVAPDLAPALSISDVKRIADRAAALVAQGRMEEAAAQSLVRRMADGMAQRSRSLKLYGNGVHPLAAAYAWRSLSYALGLWPVDLEAAGADGDATRTVPSIEGMTNEKRYIDADRARGARALRPAR